MSPDAFPRDALALRDALRSIDESPGVDGYHSVSVDLVALIRDCFDRLVDLTMVVKIANEECDSYRRAAEQVATEGDDDE